ncbi:Tetraspanin/Peripherin [Trypanosoma melophagium]|uniref:Tetraspanin/Peripherin n=1 Tax=Trypanosoma melophagium TaxID=715481 RepID=UPI00351A35FA|nr:Tetraspanin/Peripherin [Trypanosoma melophagium]
MRGTKKEKCGDSFVDNILNDSIQTDPREPLSSQVSRSIRGNTSNTSPRVIQQVNSWSSYHRRNSNDSQMSDTSGNKGNYEPMENIDRGSLYSKETLRSLFGYALIFINFTFIVASMLLIMSGIVARSNAAVRLCGTCSNIALSALILGIILWLFTIFGFIWIRQRQMMFLLVYVALLVFLFVALIVLIIVAAIYDRDARVNVMDPKLFLYSWERSVNDTKKGENYDICNLQERFNCSGFQFGCCVPEDCYNASEPPEWVEQVCPVCPSFPPMSTVVCTGVVYSTVRKNMGGFLVIIFFSMVLVVAGILFAFLSRSANRLMSAG